MEAKLFEVKDGLTFITVLAVRMLKGQNYQENHLLSKAECQDGIVMMTRIGRGLNDEAHYDPCTWSDRNVAKAHKYIATHWSSLASGDMIDVEFILAR